MTVLSALPDELIREGVALAVATRDRALRPQLARAWAPELLEQGTRLRLCVEAPPYTPTRQNLVLGAEIAVTLVRPSTNASLQFKGLIETIGPVTPEQLVRVERHHEAYAAEVEPFGVPNRLAARLLKREALLSVTLDVHDRFDATPGPTAGARL